MIIRGNALQKDKSTGIIRVRHLAVDIGDRQIGDKECTAHAVKTAIQRACITGSNTVPAVLLEGIDDTFPFPDHKIPVLSLFGDKKYVWAHAYAAPKYSASSGSYTYYTNNWREDGKLISYTAFIFLSKDASKKIFILVRHLASHKIAYIKEVVRTVFPLSDGILISDRHLEEFVKLAPPSMDWAIEALRLDMSGLTAAVYQPFE